MPMGRDERKEELVGVITIGRKDEGKALSRWDWDQGVQKRRRMIVRRKEDAKRGLRGG